MPPFRSKSALLAGIVVAACRAEPAGSRAAAPAPAWRLEQVAEIAPEGDAAARIVSIAADADGNIYVADGGTGMVRVFDSLGAAVRTIGRKGRGRGEFGDLHSLAWIGDTLVALDPGNSRIELMSRTGAWVTSWPGAHRADPGARLHQSGASAVYMQGHRLAEEGTQRSFLLAGPGVPADTIVAPPDPPKAPNAGGVLCDAKEGTDRFATPWDSRVIDAVSPDGYLVRARSDDYRIVFFDRAGTAQRVTMYGAVPVPITDAEWDSVLSEYATWRGRVNPVKCEPAALPRPATRPALRAIEFDDQGRMWIEATVAGGFNLHVYDGAGGMLSNVPAPARDPAVPFVVRGNGIFLVAASASGERVVRSFRIVVATELHR